MQQLEAAIQAQLLNNVSVDDIVADLDTTRARVLSVQRQTMQTLARGELINAAVDVNEVAKNNLEILNTRAQQAAIAVIEKAKIMAANADTAGELQTIAETIAKLQVAFFKDTSTNVNIQNNYGEGNGQRKYGNFLQDAPGIINN